MSNNCKTCRFLLELSKQCVCTRYGRVTDADYYCTSHTVQKLHKTRNKRVEKI